MEMAPLNVSHGSVLALWIGVDLPANVTAGLYEGQVHVSEAGQAKQWTVAISLTVEGSPLADRGDSSVPYARLRWLDESIGHDDQPTRRLAVSTTLGRT